MTGPQLRKLIGILNQLFDLESFSEFLHLSLDIRDYNLVRASDLPTTLYKVLERIDRERNLLALLDAVIANFPSQPELPDQLEEFRLAAANPTLLPEKLQRPNLLPEKLQSLILGTTPRYLFVNRTQLRNHLEKITTANHGYRVLSLRGGVCCGESHSWWLIEDVARTMGYMPVHVDLSNYELADACQYIALRLGLDWQSIDRRLVDKPKPERMVMRYWEEIGTLSKGLTAVHWLVLDGLDSQSIDRDILNLLVPRLLERIQKSPLPNIFPILIGDNATRVSKVRRETLHEDILDLTPTEVETYIKTWCTRNAYNLGAAEINTAANRMFDRVPPEAEGSDRFQYVHDHLDEFLIDIEKAAKEQSMDGGPSPDA